MKAVEPARKILPLPGDPRFHRILEKPVKIELADPRTAAAQQSPDDVIEFALVVEPLGPSREQIVQQVRFDALHRIVRPQVQKEDKMEELTRKFGIDRDKPAADRPP